jgi:hypothetical protein
MIDGDKYVEKVTEYFSYLIEKYNYTIIKKEIRGNTFYCVEYGDQLKVVSISYENIEDYFQVVVFILTNGRRPGYDDKTQTLHLNKLNQTILSIINKDEIVINNEYFSKFRAGNIIERKILKSAKELRLCLNHFNAMHFSS